MASFCTKILLCTLGLASLGLSTAVETLSHDVVEETPYCMNCSLSSCPKWKNSEKMSLTEIRQHALYGSSGRYLLGYHFSVWECLYDEPVPLLESGCQRLVLEPYSRTPCLCWREMARTTVL